MFSSKNFSWLTKRWRVATCCPGPLWKSLQDPADSAVSIYSKRLTALNYDSLTSDLNAAASIALRFTLRAPWVDIVLVGSTNLEHWRHNAALLAAGPLPQAQFEAKRTRWQRVMWWLQRLPGRQKGWHGWV